ncbi:protein SEH1-like isoform X3 [Rhododendron vialii]|uniref:protein SEH1-like isoform X3 n=1 Tax=Rhododendron vialii TaxID=182163 RepID=UPI00265F1CD3|nr:protein SEH1-like isoform X3 [Rhododendron vialii]
MTLITTGTHKQIALWHLGLNPNIDGKLSTEKVWEMEWNISGMTLATTGGDGVVSLWQSNLKGVHLPAVFEVFEPTI